MSVDSIDEEQVYTARGITVSAASEQDAATKIARVGYNTELVSSWYEHRGGQRVVVYSPRRAVGVGSVPIAEPFTVTMVGGGDEHGQEA